MSEGEDFRGLDWYGDDLGARSFVDGTFTDVDLSETTSRGATFERCVFHNCRFNASTHTSTAFVACEFRRTNFFDAILDGCKLAGSVFADCTLRPIKVVGGQWQGVTIRGGNLSKLDLTGLDLREADLSLSNLSGAVLRDVRLDGAALRDTDLTGADLRGASLVRRGPDRRPARADAARSPRRRTAGGAARRGRRPVVAVSTLSRPFARVLPCLMATVDRVTAPHVVVLFGATGDLARRKLLPGLLRPDPVRAAQPGADRRHRPRRPDHRGVHRDARTRPARSSARAASTTRRGPGSRRCSPTSPSRAARMSWRRRCTRPRQTSAATVRYVASTT